MAHSYSRFRLATIVCTAFSLIASSLPHGVLAAPSSAGTVTVSVYDSTVTGAVYGQDEFPPAPNLTPGTTEITPQQALALFNNGQPVPIKQLFADQVLATYFAEWVTQQGFPVDVSNTITREQLKSVTPAVNTYSIYPDNPFNASGKGITSLVGMEVFNEYTGVPYTLDFSHNNLINVDGLGELVGIVNIPNQSSLNIDLSHNQLTNLEGFKKLTHVDKLVLNDNQLTTLTGLSTLSHVGKLLDLHNNKLTSLNGLEYIEPSEPPYSENAGFFVHYRTFDFSANNISDASALRHLTRLTNLDLHNNNLSDLSFLANLTEAQKIDVSYNKLTSTAGLNAGLVCPRFNDSQNFIPLARSALPAGVDKQNTQPQNSFAFNQPYANKTVTVEYREDSPAATLLDSEVISDPEIGVPLTYSPKDIPGYEPLTTAPETVQFISDLSQNLDLYKVVLNGSKVLAKAQLDITGYTFVPADPNVVAYHDGSDGSPSRIQVVADGSTSISVYQAGLFLGSYPVDVAQADESNARTVTFYYKKLGSAPTEPPVVNHTLTITKDGEGSTTPEPVGKPQVFSDGTKVTLTASPSEGWQFVKWTVNGIDYNNPSIIVSIDSDKVATAHFAPATGVIQISYVDETGNDLLPTSTKEYVAGEHTFTAKEITGYVLQSSEQQSVKLSPNQSLKIFFYYKKEEIPPTTQPPSPTLAPVPVPAPTSKPVIILPPAPTVKPAPAPTPTPTPEPPSPTLQPEPTPTPMTEAAAADPSPEPTPEAHPEKPSPFQLYVPEPRPAAVKETGKIYGIVTDSNGQPILGVQVELPTMGKITYTDNEGRYSFDSVKLGAHELLLYNPVTKQSSKIEVIAYIDDIQKDAHGVKLYDEVDSVVSGVELKKGDVKRRIDFIVSTIEQTPPPSVTPQPSPKPVPTELPPVHVTELPAPKKLPPLIPFLPFLLIVIFPLFRRNVIIYSMKTGSEKGAVLRRLRLKPKGGIASINLTGLSADEFRIVFKQPRLMKDVDLVIIYKDMQTDPVRLTGQEKFIDFSPLD